MLIHVQRFLGLLALAAALVSCQSPAAPSEQAPMDVHSYSQPDRVRVHHAELDWTLHFDTQTLEGTVTWHLNRVDASAPLVLDTKDLIIQSVEVGAKGTFVPATFEHSPSDPAFGQPLIIALNRGDDQARIRYQTTKEGDGLQWLKPEQTAGGRKPFLFSQAQSIMARSFVPCQDSPGVRFSFGARVAAPDGLRPVMAARIHPERESDGSWGFDMPQAIPSYLLAIACGDLTSRSLGPRSRVWAEPEIVERAAFEFADTERMIAAAEELYGPYRWEQYDLLVLPPSFPFGGMENPRLTFATPTILAGDRSLVALVAHELAHSWSGNLVTNATWSDFWMNEGFTVYFERRIMEAVYGRERAEMEAVLGRQDLQEDLDELPEAFTKLKTDLEGHDPDDAFSNVPYEKGYLFLRLIEETIGRKRMDPFLMAWFEENAFQSRTTEQFLSKLRRLLTDDEQARIRIDEWVYHPGVPDNAPIAVTPVLAPIEKLAQDYAAGRTQAPALEAGSWSYHEWVHFLRNLPEDIDRNRLSDLDLVYQLSGAGNSEVLHEWLLLAIRGQYEPAMPALEAFLKGMGRRKFLKPLYSALMESPGGQKRARSIYRAARSSYHAMAQGTLDPIVRYQP